MLSKTVRKDMYAQFRAPLMHYFLRRVKDRAEAEDLTQEVFVRLLRTSSLDQIEHVEAFVFRIASNLLHDRGRQVTRGHRPAGALVDLAVIHEMASEFAEGPSEESVLVHRETLGAVLKCLDELEDRTRNIFLLFRLEGMKQRDIAELYGISQSTVEKHVMRASMHLALRFR